VEDIYLGDLSSSPASFNIFDNQLYFSAKDNPHGVELWRFYQISKATVASSSVSSISINSAQALAQISASGGGDISSRGFVWSSSTQPTTISNDGQISESGSFGLGDFSASISSLSCGTSYYLRPYAINEDGTSYGGETLFTTSACVCSTLTNAASYNSYPTCGAASCNSGYTLSGSGSSAICVTSSGGGGGSGGGSFSLLMISRPFKGAFSLLINQGEAVTSQNLVWLSFGLNGKAITHIQTSEDKNLFGALKNPYSGLMPFNLSSGEGRKTVYAKLWMGNDYSENIISSSINYQSSQKTAGPSTPSSGSSPMSSWGTGELDNWGNQIICSIENFSPEQTEKRRGEALTMKNRIKDLISQEKEESFLNRVKRMLLEKRLSGQILLQVEEKGEAWYINPDDNRRYFLGRPTDMFNVMKKFGLGATHQYISQTKTFPARLAGKILIDVEDLGKAYFIDPITLKKYYLACPSHSFYVVRRLGLGISNADINLLKSGLTDD
jgi:hypothetical protein